MKMFQPLCMTMLMLSLAAHHAQASEQIVSDESLGVSNFSNLGNHPGWARADLPYARLLAQADTLNAAPRWRNAGPHQGALPPATAAAPAVQQANVPPVPEASMVSMLLVGLGLLAFGMHGEKQEKFDS